MKKCLRNSSGATMIEFAIVFPVVMAFMIGLMPSSNAIWSVNIINHAVDIAARCGVAEMPDPSSSYSL